MGKKEVRSNAQSAKAEMAELNKIYQEAWAAGIFLCEFSTELGCVAAAGSVKRLEKFEKLLGWTIDLHNVTHSQCVNLGTLSATGPTRAAACREAIRLYQELHKRITTGVHKK